MLVNDGVIKVILITDVVPILPKISVPRNEMVYIAPSTNVAGFVKVVVPAFSSLSLRFTT